MSKFTRRRFLYGLNGSILTIPLLPSLFLPKEAKAMEADDNLKFYYTQTRHGFDHRYYFTDPASWDVDDVQNDLRYVSLMKYGPAGYSEIIGNKFNAIRGKINVIRGLDMMSGEGAHTDKLPLSGGTGLYSLDAVLEESKIFYKTPLMRGALRYGTASNISTSSKGAMGQTLPAESDLMKIYNNFFNINRSEIMATRDHISRITHHAFEDYKRVVANTQISQADNVRLQNYMDLVSDTEKRLQTMKIVDQCATLDRANLSGSSNEQVNEVAFNLEIAALACGITKIVVHKMHGQIEQARKSTEDSYHGVAHSWDRYLTESGKLAKKEYDKYHFDMISRVLTKMDAIVEPNGKTLLDNTLFLSGNTCSTGSHQTINVPTFMAGATGHINTGLFVDYSSRKKKIPKKSYGEYPGRPYPNLLVSILQTFGLGPSDYKVLPGQTGFGLYSQTYDLFKDHYAQYGATETLRNQKLPVIFK